MNPTVKHQSIDNFLATLGIDRKGSVEAEVCATCGAMVNPNEFKDALSLKEYRISGMCQKCQDAIFTEED